MEDEFDGVTELLPEGWKEKAKELGALKRRRNIKMDLSRKRDTQILG